MTDDGFKSFRFRATRVSQIYLMMETHPWNATLAVEHTKSLLRCGITDEGNVGSHSLALDIFPEPSDGLRLVVISP